MICHRRELSRRHSFTLVELMIVTSILAVLASAVLFALFGVNEDAKEARTRAQIAKIHEMLLAKWESYETRAVRISLPAGLQLRPEPFSDQANTLGVLNGRWDAGEEVGTGYTTGVARFRLDLLRDLMRMELPDRITDVLEGPANINPGYPGISVAIQIPEPSVHRSYKRRAQALAGASWATAWTRQAQGAECLYLIVASIREGDVNGLDTFRESEIGDTDGDGMPEILDGWGNPIEFLRWAPGHLSEMQSGDPTNDSDPFDPLRVDTRPVYRLVPLVYSAGRDGILDIGSDYDTDPSTAVPPSADPPINHPNFDAFNYVNYASSSYGNYVPNDPYHVHPSRLPQGFGVRGNNGSGDNITNHLLGASL